MLRHSPLKSDKRRNMPARGRNGSKARATTSNDSPSVFIQQSSQSPAVQHALACAMETPIGDENRPTRPPSPAPSSSSSSTERSSPAAISSESSTDIPQLPEGYPNPQPHRYAQEIVSPDSPVDVPLQFEGYPNLQPHQCASPAASQNRYYANIPKHPGSFPIPQPHQCAQEVAADQTVDLSKAVADLRLAVPAPTPVLAESRNELDRHARSAIANATVNLSVKELVALVVEAIDARTTKPADQSPAPAAPEGEAPTQKRVRASKLEYKLVNEIWNSASSKYEIETAAPTPEVSELDEYIFVDRKRIEKKIGSETSFLDIKSELLRHCLEDVLENVKAPGLREEEPRVESRLLYHYMEELEQYRDSTANEQLQKELVVLVRHLQDKYSGTKRHIEKMAQNQEITFEQLWTLFKPGEIVYGECVGTRKPRCIVFDIGSFAKLDDGTKYFKVEGRYLDNVDGSIQEAVTALGVVQFDGAKRISSLEAFPFEYHPYKAEMQHQLIEYGKKFHGLAGSHHRSYNGRAFLKTSDGLEKVVVAGRIMVDTKLFMEFNPDYVKPQFSDLKTDRRIMRGFSIPGTAEAKASPVSKLGRSADERLLLSSPTIFGFDLAKRLWLELAVADIKDIEWNLEPWECLRLPQEKKDLIYALGASHLSGRLDGFDDIVKGKGKGLVMLFHGPPGVGKTLTAEGLSEILQRPLYSISSADLFGGSTKAESQLSQIFRQVEEWGAVFLLDEADAFVSKRLGGGSYDMATMFLRRLEYFKGVMVLTTNRVTQFDEAMVSRIHFAYRFPELLKDTRGKIWGTFLDRVPSAVTDKEIDRIAEQRFNGRQVKNMVMLSHAWAGHTGDKVTYRHLKAVVEMHKEFTQDFEGHGATENLRSYT